MAEEDSGAKPSAICPVINSMTPTVIGGHRMSKTVRMFCLKSSDMKLWPKQLWLWSQT